MLEKLKDLGLRGASFCALDVVDILDDGGRRALTLDDTML